MVPPFPASQGAPPNYKKLGDEEPADHAIGKSRGGMTCKIHLATDGKGRPLGLVLTAGQVADISFFQTVLANISVTGGSRGRPRTRPDRVQTRPIPPAPTAATWPTEESKSRFRSVPTRSQDGPGAAPKGGRPRSFDKEAYKGRNVVERCFNRLKQWRGIATRSDKKARSYLAGVTVASALIWIKSGV